VSAGGLRQALGFLTPVGGAATPSPRALAWFPVAGGLVGLAVGGAWWAAAKEWTPAVAAGLAVATDVAATGMLHLDGVCDAADGLLPHLSRERRLEVMSGPEVGAFGVVVVATVLLLRWAGFEALRPAIVLIVALWAASRTWMVLAMQMLPYARPTGGLATAFRPERANLALGAATLVVACLVAAAWRPTVGPVAVGAGTLAAAGVLALGYRRVGGYTGDILGAAGVIGETVGLLVACAKW
jgi:adenosylcobinamide-GDP ribazoletransferase